MQDHGREGHVLRDCALLQELIILIRRIPFPISRSLQQGRLPGSDFQKESELAPFLRATGMIPHRCVPMSGLF